MDGVILKRVIKENQDFAENVKLMYRKFDFESRGNYVFIGIRRAGKSYLMFQRIQELLKSGTKKEEILFINFEDDRLLNFKTEDFENLKTAYHELYDTKPIFFLDEIQIVDGWEKFVRRLADQGFTVYVTGSNAKMLSSEIMTTLGGRFLVQDVYPFSLKEFLDYSKVKIDSKNWLYDNKTVAEVSRKTDTYFYFGGFPELTIYNDKRQWLSSLYQKIFFGDLISRYAVKNPNILRIMIGKIAESVMQPISFNRITHILSSIGQKVSINTVIQYFTYLKETLLIFSVNNFAVPFSERETVKKYYFTDNGILNLFLFNPEAALLENIVALYLYKKYGSKLFYYNKNVETDFYVPDEKLLVQVSYTLTNQDTLDRKVKSLVKTCDFLSGKKLLIVTKSEEKTLELSGKKIEIIPVWKFLLQDFI
jgi:hypothetical protein